MSSVKKEIKKPLNKKANNLESLLKENQSLKAENQLIKNGLNTLRQKVLNQENNQANLTNDFNYIYNKFRIFSNVNQEILDEYERLMNPDKEPVKKEPSQLEILKTDLTPVLNAGNNVKINNSFLDFKNKIINTAEINLNNLIDQDDEDRDYASIISITHFFVKDPILGKYKWVSKFFDPEIESNHNFNNMSFQEYEANFFTLERLNFINNVSDEINSYISYDILSTAESFNKFVKKMIKMAGILEKFFSTEYYNKKENSLVEQIKGYLYVLKMSLNSQISKVIKNDLYFSRVSRASQIIEGLIRSTALLIHENHSSEVTKIKTRSLNDLLISRKPDIWLSIFSDDIRLILKNFLVKNHYQFDDSRALRNEFAHNTSWANAQIATNPMKPIIQIFGIFLFVFNHLFINKKLLNFIHTENTKELILNEIKNKKQ
ncbi:hypothetical protein ACA758_01585 [Mycoplasmopsis agassizii]|uniref:hypothetical protein n=1 Tax=Mycoplasmopsis agassizii TaxID=33922 RepID=UPI00352734ED